MIIKSVQVQNFRSLKDVKVECDSLTSLVGANGAGKSSFLRALQLFYSSNPKYTEADFYAGDTSKEIRIRVTFGDLSPVEREEFRSHIQGDLLTVEKELSWPVVRHSRGLFGWTRQNPGFKAVRRAESAKEAKEKYEALRSSEGWTDLPRWTSKDAVLAALDEWEISHPEQSKWEKDDGQFFGFKEVGQYNLGRHTRFILIPAVRDAAEEAAEARGCAIFEIMELVVRSRLARHKVLEDLREQTQRQYDDIIDPKNVPELANLAADLSSTLRMFVPDSEVVLEWLESQRVDLPLPKAEVKLLDESKGHPCPVDRTGHGLQRSFILTLLQHLAVTQGVAEAVPDVEKEESGESEANTGARTSPLPSLILAIEEPELYLHPNRQRHMAQVLLKLAMGDLRGLTDQVQVIYSTHSPFFVGVDRFPQIRLFRKVPQENELPKSASVYRATLDDIARTVEQADGKPSGTYTGQTLEPRLQTLMTPWMNEGFFADLVVLVEGEEDRAAILAVASARGYNFEAEGISVIPCKGKSNMDRASGIFGGLGIPVYLVWDGDFNNKDADAKENHRLQRLLGRTPVDYPEFIGDRAACFLTTLTNTLCEEIGPETYNPLVEETKTTLGLSGGGDSRKNPMVIRQVIPSASRAGKTSRTLEEIVERIRNLRFNGLHRELNG